MPKQRRLSPTALKRLRATPMPTGPRNRLPEAIHLAGCQQRDVVRATGIPQANLSRIINQQRFQTVTIDTAQRLAAFFGASVDVLFPSPYK